MRLLHRSYCWAGPLVLVLLLAAVTFTGCKDNVEGCTDPTALNYNPDAIDDNGSCKYPVDGCTDPLATNYSPTATNEDGSCEFHGCTDPTADNFDPDATVDDGNCLFFGCTDPTADNYAPDANADDGSCIDARLKFSGQRSVETGCAWPFDLASSTAFTYNAETASDTIWLSPFSAAGDAAYALISGSTLTMPEQTFGALLVRTYEGAGSIDTGTNEVTIDFDYSVPFLGGGSCTATYTLQ